ncbi:GNAT family N-acetyltransferase [Rhodobacteraceae bacterium 2CG4]|uniref:GNAT family N-acetyltransferase n=1 Tax=Halovulum marinum TaxID=2662447 RepID=A0A6L5Z1T5_9RHOB|nr:GNAT family N-acetyltransferase [Halovulum marinum]MSU90030.1 GNAT family N-acetyltransferase [Halovulum marinum]
MKGAPIPLRVTRVDRRNMALLEHLADEVFDAPIEPGHLSDYLDDPCQHLLVAVLRGTVVGQLKAVIHRHPEKPPNLFIEELGVASAHRRLGIGTALAEKATQLARQEGCAEIWLATEPENTEGNALYAALGMRAQHVVMYNRVL